MPNIGSVLKEEIVRLSRKEARSQIDPAKKASVRHRRDIAELKRQVAQLERHVASLLRRAPGGSATAPAANKGGSPRFSAKGLQAQRGRLDLSAEDFGKLLGVSAQSVYNWEHAKARPRAEQIAKVAALRVMGKREARARLERLAAPTKAGKRKS